MNTQSNTPFFAARQTAKLTIAADTIEHRIRAKQLPLADQLGDCFAVVQRPVDQADRDPEGRASDIELLTVSRNNQLLHVKRDITVDSGWGSEEVLLPKVRADGQSISGNIVQISAFYQRQRIYAMVHFPGHNSESRVVVAMCWSEEKGWHELRLQNDVANALYSTKQTDVYRTPSGNHFFYGVSTAYEFPQMFVVFETGTAGRWAAVSERVSNPNSTYRLLPGSGGSSGQTGHTLLDISSKEIVSREFLLDEDDDGYYIEWGTSLSSIALSAAANSTKNQLSAANVFPFPSRLGTKSLLLLDEQKTLRYVAGYTENALRETALTGGTGQPVALENISVARDRFDRATVFATSALDRRLWILRQSGLDANGDLIFSDWVCLGNIAATIACPRAMLDGAELFLVQANTRQLVHLRQNEKTSIWHRTQIQVAKTGVGDAKVSDITAQATSVHALDIRAEDKDGVPTAGAALELRSEVACDVSINGVVRQLNSERWTKVNTDVAGKLSLAIVADTLTAPNIQIKITATGEIYNGNPDAKIAGRLRGQDPRVPLNVMNLRKAGIIPDQVEGEAANNIVSMMKQIGKASEASDGQRSDGAAPGTARKFTMDSANSGNAFIRRTEVSAASVGTHSQFHQTLPASTPAANDPAAGKPQQFLGDILNWLENAWEDVTKFVITTVNDTVNFVVSLGEKVIEFVVNTAEGIARAFESLVQGLAAMFREIGEAIVDVVERVVKFVQALFGWEDIVVTNKMLKLAVNDMLESAENFFSVEAASWLQRQVDSLQAEVDKIFDQLEDTVGPLDPQEQKEKIAGSSLGGSMQDSMEDNRLATDTAQNQIQREPDPVASASNKISSGEDDPFKMFYAQMESDFNKMKEAIPPILDDFKPRSMEELFSQGIHTAVRIMRPLVKFAIGIGGSLLQLALRLIGRVIKALKDLLNTELHIPLISDFYEEASGEKLVIMDIATLLIAAPMTIIYKLVLGGKDLDPPFTQQSIDDFNASGISMGGIMSASAAVASKGESAVGRGKSASAMQPVYTTFDPNAILTAGDLAERVFENIEDAMAFAFHESIKFLRNAAKVVEPWVKAFTIAAGFFDFVYGWIASVKHTADAHDMSGMSGKLFRLIGYVGKVIRFALTVPGLLVLLVSIIDKIDSVINPDPDDIDDSPFQAPFILSALTLIFTIIGLGLTIFDATLIANFVVDTVAGIILFVATIYTVIVLLTRNNPNGDPAGEMQEGFEQFATLIGAIPGVLAWLLMAIPIANLIAPGSGEVLLLVLIVTEVACATVCGLLTILSVAVPGAVYASDTPIIPQST